MFKFLEQDKYLKKLSKMTNEELLKEYVNIRSKGSLLCSLGNVKNKDVDNWAACEDYLTKTKKVDFELLNRFATAFILLNSSSIKTSEKEDLEIKMKEAKEAILKNM